MNKQAPEQFHKEQKQSTRLELEEREKMEKSLDYSKESFDVIDKLIFNGKIRQKLGEDAEAWFSTENKELADYSPWFFLIRGGSIERIKMLLKNI